MTLRVRIDRELLLIANFERVRNPDNNCGYTVAFGGTLALWFASRLALWLAFLMVSLTVSRPSSCSQRECIGHRSGCIIETPFLCITLIEEFSKTICTLQSASLLNPNERHCYCLLPPKSPQSSQKRAQWTPSGPGLKRIHFEVRNPFLYLLNALRRYFAIH